MREEGRWFQHSCDRQRKIRWEVEGRLLIFMTGLVPAIILVIGSLVYMDSGCGS